MTYLICGVDEVGRGALAGPLMAVAAVFNSAVSFPNGPYQQDRLLAWETEHCPIIGVDDSKKLTSKKREEAYHRILRSSTFVDFGLGEVSSKEIDEIGIEWANSLAFQRAMADLEHKPNYVLIDGDSRIMTWDHEKQRNAPKGDATWWPVGAASILAKVIRDSFMAELAADHPLYGWENNAGYGASKHVDALSEHGPTIHHRAKFIRNIRRT